MHLFCHRSHHCKFAMCLVALGCCVAASPASAQWKRHTIDDTSRGADGVRLGDVDGDGRQDLVCGWEEGGVIRVYLQPSERVREPWPRVTVGKVKSPEDAVFVDLDNDGRLDVLSSTEGRNRTLYIHWANWTPKNRAAILDASNWKTAPLPCATANQSWMFATPMELDGRPGPEVIVGSKGRNATISLLSCQGADRRKLDDFHLQELYSAGWIMSLRAADIDLDGDQDVLSTDRKGANAGLLWLENPGVSGVQQGAAWKTHRMAGENHEVMFLDYGNLIDSDDAEVIFATRNQEILIARRPHNPRDRWPTQAIPNPYGTPHGKAVAIADVDGDNRPDLIHTVNNGGNRAFPGAAWLKALEDGKWEAHNISGKQGVKFDLIQVMDVDQDGDLDWLSCEERDNLGLFWYENPTR